MDLENYHCTSDRNGVFCSSSPFVFQFKAGLPGYISPGALWLMGKIHLLAEPRLPLNSGIRPSVELPLLASSGAPSQGRRRAALKGR